MAATDRAVVVGITQYPGMGDLDGPENDAVDFARWMQDPRGGDVPEAGITLILSSHYPPATSASDAQPTAEAVLAAFTALWDEGLASRSGKVGRRLFLYMAGHGFAPDLTSAAVLTANATKSRLGLHIPGPAYADLFRQAGFFEEVVLLMDCCRSNFPKAPLHQPRLKETTSPKPSNFFYGFATTFNRPSREVPGEDGRVNGIFTRTLLAGLRGAAAHPATGRITGASLAAYAYNAGRAGAVAATSTQSRQDPEFQFPQEPEIVWVDGAAAPPAFSVRVARAPGGADRPVQLLDGVLQAVAPSSSSAELVEWQGLAPGLYLLEVGGAPSQSLKLIGAGGTVDVTV